MNGLNSLEGLQQAAGAEFTTTFPSIESAVNSNEFYIVNDPKVYTPDNIIEFNKAVEVTPELTGGSQVGSNIVTLSAGTAGVTATSVGTSVLIPLAQVVGSVLAGVGLGVVAYELKPEFWTAVSNKIFGTEIEYAEISQYSIRSLFKDNTTYIPEEVVEKIVESLTEQGYFNKNFTLDTDFTSGSFTFVPTLSITETLQYALNVFVSSGVWSEYSHFASYISANISNIVSGIVNEVEKETGASISNFPYVLASIGPVDATRLCYVNLYFLSLSSEFYGQPATKYEGVTSSGAPYKYIQHNGSSLLAWSGGASINYYPSSGAFSITFGKGASRIRTSIYAGYKEREATNCNAGYTGGIKGIVEQEDAVTPREGLTLPENYPSWYQRLIEVGGSDLSYGNIFNTSYLPLGVPNTNPLTSGVSQTQSDAQEGTAEESMVEEYTKPTTFKFPSSGADPTEDPIPTDPSSGGGATPIIVPPFSSATSQALFTAYNPSSADVNGLARYLWTTDIITQLKSLFQSPIDAIISFMNIWCTPTTGSSGNIVLGTIDTLVTAPIITNQYTTIECGEVSVPELYGDATDYAPYTSVSLYLPFIGVVDLNPNEVIGGKVKVTYYVDVLTACCLANVTVKKGNCNAVLYTYEGNCGVEMPLTSADRSRQFGTAAAIALGAVTQNPMMIAGGAISAAGGGARVQIERSGGFSGNAGSMGIKKPYIIVTRTNPYTADNYNSLYGYPSNKRVTLGSLSGFTRVKDVNVNTVSATDEEKEMLDSLLKEGIFI